MFIYYINVPMNEKGIHEFEEYDEQMPNVKTYELSEIEYTLLRKKGGLFEKIDSEIGTVIDVCEEERININQIDNAINIVGKYCKRKLDISEEKACKLIMDSLYEAKKAGTFWEIDIYLE